MTNHHVFLKHLREKACQSQNFNTVLLCATEIIALRFCDKLIEVFGFRTVA